MHVTCCFFSCSKGRAPIAFIWKPYICMKDGINGSYFKWWLWSALMNLTRPLFWISDWWFYFLHLITSPKGTEELEWPVPFPTHKSLCNKYIIGHRASSEIQGIFLSSSTYKTMDPHLFEKEKNYFFFFFRRRTVPKIVLFRDAYSEECNMK